MNKLIKISASEIYFEKNLHKKFLYFKGTPVFPDG